MPFINIPSSGSASWKDAVADPASLPASGNEVGDARVTESTSEIYIWDGTIWNLASGGGGPAITDLTNDVTATGPGSAVATVAFVGGETAADVATSVQDTQAATDLSTVSTIVKRDASGETSLDGLNLDGSVSGAINIKAADTTTGYTIKMPNAQGGATTYLENDGSGNLSWGTVSAGMTNPMTTQGDLITGGAAGAPQRLGLGTEEYVLAAGATDPYWTIEGVKTGYPTDTVIVGRTKPAGLTGIQNTIIGDCANAITSSTDNFVVGKLALNSLTTNTTTGHVAIGKNALSAYNSGGNSSGVVAIGADTLKAATTILNDPAARVRGAVAIGNRAGEGATTVNGCVFIGELAGRGTGTLSACVAIGSAAVNQGSANIGIGNYALAQNNASSTGNCVIGHTSGISVSSGSNNLLLGNVCAQALTTGSSNVLLGASTNTTANNTSSAIALGTTSVAASNEFAVGSATSQINTMLLGRGGASQTVANAVKIQTMRSSGTDTDMSAGTLTLAGAQGTGTGAGGDVIIATAPPDVASGSTLNAHFEVMRITDDGLVGIQTSTPSDPLTVQGAINYTNGSSDYKISPAHHDEGTETGNFTINWSNAPVHTVTLNGTTNAVVTMNNPLQGGAYVLRIIQGATPGTIDFTAGDFADAVWPGGTAPTLSGSTGDVDIINLLYIDDGGGAVTYYGTFATDFS